MTCTYRPTRCWVLSPLLLISLTSPAEAVVNGSVNDECVFPSAVYIEGCTATLVNQRAIATALHCSPGAGTLVTLGEEAIPTRFSTQVTSCITDSNLDAVICELEDPILDVPLTPIAFGCEVEKYMVEGRPVWFSGYGNREDMTPTDQKRWAQSFIAEVHSDHTVIGEVRDESSTTPSPCRGDSGGPVFLRTDDGSYRVFGALVQGTTATPCNGAAEFQRLEALVDQFESETGLDISPCFDGKTGDWEPTAECGGFYAGDAETSVGTWAARCADAMVSDSSAACGEAFSEPVAEPSEDDGEEAGCGCRTGISPPQRPSAFSLVPLFLALGLFRRRTSHHRNELSTASRPRG